MKTKRLMLLFFTISFIGFNQCKKDDPKTLSVSVVSENVSKDAGNFTFYVYSNINWSVSSDVSWCTLSVTSGSGDGTVLVNVSANTITSQRTANITVSGSDVNPIKITVNQEAGSSSLTETLTDYDGNIYNAVQIGNQVWMTENLKVIHYSDGESIPLVTDSVEWANLDDNDDACCYYANDYNSEYGVLYTWTAAMGDNTVGSNTNPSGVQGVCPDGWHLPSEPEWHELIDYLGGDSNAGGKLKESDTTHWKSPNIDADNSSRFTGLPGGGRDQDGAFISLRYYGFWWSTTDVVSYASNDLILYYNNSEAITSYYYKSSGLSVRCVKD